jgi:COP9 signalosome complex subunit 6
MAGLAANELLSTQQASDSGLQVVLHPLPILEISDFITRGYQRDFTGAVVGALLGQQNGREVTIEHSFSCKSAKNADGFYELDRDWFKQRLEQSVIPPVPQQPDITRCSANTTQ